MKAKVTTMLAFAATTTLPCNESTFSQQGLPRLDNRALSREVAGAIANIAVQTGGNVLLVECSGAFGFDTIQSAIDAAEDGDVVVVLPRNAFGFECEGDAYVENINFLGKGITVQSLIPTNADYVKATTIDGSGAREKDEQGSVVAFNNCETADSVLNGLTLTGGFGFSSPPHGYRAGGGIYCYTTSPTIRNSVITGNTAGFFGGGIYCRSGSSPTIENCRISSNTADNRGGGIYCVFNSAAAIRGCIITDNFAFIRGGGIYLESSSNATILDCVIADNSTSYDGGGISSTTSSPVISRCEILGNLSNRNGGGIMLSRETSSVPSAINNCLITMNSAAASGGGIYLLLNSVTINNCTIANNAARDSGGGVFAARNSWKITNSVLWGDNARLGSEVYLFYSKVHTEASELTVEYSDVQGGAGGPYVEDGSTLDWGCGNIDLDPEFVDPTFGDYHITLLSLARNAGDPDFVPREDETDIDGDERVHEGRVDMGADEFVIEPAPLTSLFRASAHIRR
ncbi:MAG: right-handed parallel beta-helix repeat-containing protein [Planctomycetota bacterium]|nr:right-handed parallel beta-helix repeat-containing protein [Planctomycetota bacterium]